MIWGYPYDSGNLQIWRDVSFFDAQDLKVIEVNKNAILWQTISLDSLFVKLGRATYTTVNEHMAYQKCVTIVQGGTPPSYKLGYNPHENYRFLASMFTLV